MPSHGGHMIAEKIFVIDWRGAWMGHEKSAKVAKYCKQHMLDAISSH